MEGPSAVEVGTKIRVALKVAERVQYGAAGQFLLSLVWWSFLLLDAPLDADTQTGYYIDEVRADKRGPIPANTYQTASEATTILTTSESWTSKTGTSALPVTAARTPLRPSASATGGAAPALTGAARLSISLLRQACWTQERTRSPSPSPSPASPRCAQPRRTRAADAPRPLRRRHALRPALPPAEGCAVVALAPLKIRRPPPASHPGPRPTTPASTPPAPATAPGSPSSSTRSSPPPGGAAPHPLSHPPLLPHTAAQALGHAPTATAKTPPPRRRRAQG